MLLIFISALLSVLLFIITLKYLQLKYNFEYKLKEVLRSKEEFIRSDAIKRSSSVVIGKIGERFAPLLAFNREGLDPREARFIGDPVDYIVFEGLKKGKPEKIWIVEVKTGNSKLTKEEKEIRKLVESKKIGWKEITL